MILRVRFSFFLSVLLLFLVQPLRAGTVAAVYNSASDVPVTASSYTATGNAVNFTLNFAPPVGTNLTVVNNTGLGFIQGTFSNLVQGQAVTLNFGGANYNFVANYFGGTGNDLVLVWASNRLVAWGDNQFGEIGNGVASSSSYITTPVEAFGVLSGRTVLTAAAGNDHSLALCSDGTVAAWGYGGDGELGSGSTSSSSLPIAVSTAAGSALAGKKVIAVSAGSYHSLALCSDGTVAAWGLNSNDQLGTGSTSSSSLPVAVQTSGTVLAGKTVVAISAGEEHSLALCSDGTVVAWGNNVYGQLGNGSTTNSAVPVAVTTSGILSGKTVMQISAGGWHSLALCTDGTVVAWGYDIDGQLGNGTAAVMGNSSVPIAVNVAGTALSGKTVTAVAAGAASSLALCSDGTVASWGDNSSAELGNGSNTSSNVAGPVTTSGTALAGKIVTAVAWGGQYGLAYCSDHSVVAWGIDNGGILGDGGTNLTVRGVAVPVAATPSVVFVATGCTSAHSLAIVASASASVPFAMTQTASSGLNNSAQLNGLVNPDGASTVPPSTMARTPATAPMWQPHPHRSPRAVTQR